jgi:hypothetical protein
MKTFVRTLRPARPRLVSTGGYGLSQPVRSVYRSRAL